MRHLVALLFISTFIGCTTMIEQNLNPRPAEHLPAAITSQIDVSNETPIFTSIEIEPNSFSNTVAYGNELLHFDYLRSPIRPDRPHELVFVYKILNDVGGTVSGLFSGMLLDAGYDCIIVQQENFLTADWVRPIINNSSRCLYNKVKGYDENQDSYDTYNAKLARGVARIIYHWIPQQQNLTGRYGFVGISMGGIHAVGAASLFPEAVVTVAIMAGGGNRELFASSREDIVIYNRERLLEQYAYYFAEKYPNARVDYQEALYKDLDSLDFGIMRAARCVNTTKIRMMITLYDTSVPTQCQWNLYHALGGPEAKLFPTGHYSLILYYFSIRSQLREWLDAAFKE